VGITAEEDCALLWIAKRGLSASLPAHWKPCRTGDGQVYYFNFNSGESEWDHPCDKVGQGRYCSPRHQGHLHPSNIEVNLVP
jgi:centrosomal protein CEP164